jgi:spermidine synthase
LAGLVGLSGAAAVGHELVWIRALALHFGSTSYAVTAVVSTFMAGLACGNAWFGRAADRSARPLALYRALELGAAVSSGAVSLFLLRGGAQLDALARACGGSTAAMCAVFALLMLVPTTLLGGTLPVLSRALSRRSQPGRALSLLYACNTCGAVIGALAPDFGLIPRLGLLTTALLLAGCNLLVALLSSPLVRAEVPAAVTARTKLQGLERAALLLSATTGFCALGLEVLWSRTLQSWAAAFVTSFSVLLALYLVALALGAALVQRWRVRSPLWAASALCLAAALYVVGSLYAAPSWRSFAQQLWPRPEGVRRTGLWYEAVATALHASYLELAVCLLLGAAFPFVAATFLRRGQAGARTGQLFVVNTLGGVVGALLTGFVGLPYLGEQASCCALALVLALVAAVCAWIAGRRWLVAVSGLAVVALVAWLPRQQLAAAHFQGAGEVLALRQGPTTSAAAVAHYVYGELHYLELQTPGVSMSNTRLGARRYMASLAHAGMLLGEHTRQRALLICYGVGNTAEALLAHRSLERLDVVDISEEVLSLAPYFGKTPLLDTRAHVFVDDGRHHLIVHDETYDVITAEPPPPNHAGVVNLYTREFYQLAKRRLSAGGVITQWLPVFQLSESDVRSMIAAFVAELPHTLLMYGYQQQLILVGSRAPLALADMVPDSVLERSLRESGLVEVEDIAAALLASDAELRQFVAGVAPLDDLHPSIAYPFEPVPEVSRMFEVVETDGLAELLRLRDAASLQRAQEGARAVRLALAALELVESPQSERRELALGSLLQPALDARPNDEHIWTLLAADSDRLRLAELALSRPGAREARGARYAVVQDAIWLQARRAYYSRDYPRALELLGQLTPEPSRRAQHALLRAGALRALGDASGSAEAYRAAAAASGDASFRAACARLAAE